METPAERAAGILLGLGDAEPVVAARSPVLLGEVRAQDAELARPCLKTSFGKQRVLFPLVGVGADFLLDERAHRTSELLVLFGEGLQTWGASLRVDWQA